jgi:phosphoglycerol transferase MdoB-like AlkP superfamily enzyme
MGTIGFTINVVSTLFLFGDLMAERTLKRVLSAVTYSGAGTLLVALTLQCLQLGSVVDTLARPWSQHEPWKLAVAAAFLAIAAVALAAMAFAGKTRSYRCAGRVGLVMYAISIAVLVVSALVAHGSPPPAYAASIDWLQLHPTLAIHQTYATASLWGVLAMVYLPLHAGRAVADALARWVTWKAVVRTVNVALVVVGWILQIVPYN